MGEFVHVDKDGSRWNVKYKSDGVYRDYVILMQVYPKVAVKRQVPMIMLNPGSFNDEKGFRRDSTLRNIRKAFLNSGYVVEILNLFNKAEPNKKDFGKLQGDEMEQSNQLYRRLDLYPNGTKVIIQWGNPQEFSREKMQDCFKYLENRHFVVFGLKNKDGVTYRHPSKWNMNEQNFVLFRQEVLNRL